MFCTCLVNTEVSPPPPPKKNHAQMQADALLDLPSLLSRYAARNTTSAFEASHTVWTAASSGAQEFLLDVRVRVPPQQLLLYRCGR